MGTMTFAFPRIRRRTRHFLALTALLVVAAAAFDWNWFRYPVEQYLVHRSHREIRIGHLDIDVGFSLEPTVHLREVYVQNAPWGSERPTAVIGAASFTFSLRSVWEGRPVISRLVLHDAEVSLERQADGLRNWRLRRPDDRGPGRVKVLRLEPHRVSIRLVRHDIDLDVTAATGLRPGGGKDLVTDASHPLAIAFDGTYGGAKFSGAATASRAITLIETDETFPIRAWMTTGKTRLDFDGTLADLYQPSSIDGDARLAGPSLAQIGPFFRTTLPASRAFEVHGRFRSGSGTTSLAKLHGRIGSTEFDGDVGIDLTKDRPKVQATLHSPLALPEDFGFLMADEHLLSNPREDTPELQSSGRTPGLDAHVSVTVEKLKSAALPELDSLRFTADLSDRVIVLKPLDLGIGGGHVKGLALVDLRQQSAAVRATVDIDGVRVEQLLARVDHGPQVTGPLQGRFDLRSHGRSLAALLGGVSGTATISMDGGTISNRLDAKLGLNGGRLLRLMFTGDRAIAIQGASLVFDFQNGIGRSSTLVFDTDQTRTEGAGVIDLRNESVDFLLRPQPKKSALLALRSSIRVRGDIRRPEVSLVRRSAVPS
jgi:uncharacterized protein involved in outer membrane biogenesis